MTDTNEANTIAAKLATRFLRRTASQTPVASSIVAPAHEPVVARIPTKAAQVITLLQRDEGVSLDDIRQATSWLPHTIRAFLTGLWKKGWAIERKRRDDHTTVWNGRAPNAAELGQL